MSIFSLNISKISKSNGSSAVNSSAYIHRNKFECEQTGERFNYSRYKQDELVYENVFLPKNAPTDFHDPEKLWNSVEKIEKQNNALLARRIILALPKELDLESQKAVLGEYVEKTFVAEGMCADCCIHAAEGNPHAHILLTTRPIKADGSWGEKEKKVYKLDRNGERIPVLNADGSQKLGKRNEKLWERERVERFAPNEKKAEEWRSAWAEICNSYLAPEDYIDHRSYERQGIDLQPTIHEGYSPRRRALNRYIKTANEYFAELWTSIKSLSKELSSKLEMKKIFDDYREYLPKKREETCTFLINKRRAKVREQSLLYPDKTYNLVTLPYGTIVDGQDLSEGIFYPKDDEIGFEDSKTVYVKLKRNQDISLVFRDGERATVNAEKLCEVIERRRINWERQQEENDRYYNLQRSRDRDEGLER